MKRLHAGQKQHQTMLGAIAHMIPNLGFFDAIGMSDRSLVRMAMDARGTNNYEQWRSAPFGSAKRGSVGRNKRRAAKRRNVVRARKQGHA